MKERTLAGLILIGGLLVLGGIGGIETDTAGILGGTMISLAGFVLIAIAIFIGNREEN
ncbi:MAG: hypothetical protein U9P63_01755 [Patescibacteria group bacterium]|nr:hypothetical protein [Patescibacteria group bacterium]